MVKAVSFGGVRLEAEPGRLCKPSSYPSVSLSNYRRLPPSPFVLFFKREESRTMFILMSTQS